jgi:serine protease
MNQHRLLIAWTIAALAVAIVFGIATVTGGGSAGTAAADSEPATEPVTEHAVSAPTTFPSVDEAPPTVPVIDTVDDPPPADQLRIVVDPAVAPERSEIEPIVAGGPSRSVGSYRSTEGIVSDVVLDELVVTTDDPAALDALLARRNGEVLEAGDPDEFGDGYTDYLVRVDPATADPANLAADLLAFEPFHIGQLDASDDAVVALLAIAADETADHGMLVSPNWLEHTMDVRLDAVDEWDPAGSSLGTNAFDWPWIQVGGEQDGGVSAAWQMLYGHGGIGNRVEVLVVDDGYYGNGDLPASVETRKADWKEYGWGANDADDGGAFHGTHVINALAGRLDNDYGVAGPGAPVVDLIVMTGGSGTWSRMRDVLDVVRDERPDVVNMSLSSTITSFIDINQWRIDRIFRKVRDDYGALPVAAAANDSRNVDAGNDLVLPCESRFVLCVGGVQGGRGPVPDGAGGSVVQDNSLGRHPGSNWGTDTGTGSVELWGPFCVYGIADPERPNDFGLQWVCGTSFASPHVAGVAALVKAANPTLDPNQIRAVLLGTAHQDPLGGEVTGTVARVDAYRAVATAMNRPYTAPEFTLVSPEAGSVFDQEDFIEIEGRFRSFANLDLPIEWRRPDGTLIGQGATLDPITVGSLPPGTNVFTASATDLFGNTAHAQVVIEIANREPLVSITSPSSNAYRYEGEEILLSGSTSDADLLHEPLPDDAVTWNVRRLGQAAPVFSTTGHDGNVAGHLLAPGDYEVEMRGTDLAGVTIADTTLLTILAIPPGESLPTVTITSPASGTVFGEGGTADAVRLTAHAVDTQDGVVPGTRMRWTASFEDTVLVLCEGGEIGGPAGTDCSDTTVEIPLSPGAPANFDWELGVQAFDSANLPGTDQLTVAVHPGVG